MRIFVSVGTDHHQFDRLVDWSDRWARSHPLDEVMVQFGTSREPVACRAEAYLEAVQMKHQVSIADVVVVSAGPGGVMEARAAGKVPVVVARRGDEHVDEHQVAFTRHLEAKQLAHRVDTEDEFISMLNLARADPSKFTCRHLDSSAPSGATRFGELVDDLVMSR